MTKEKLYQMRLLVSEADQLQKELDNAKPSMVTDSVKGSSIHFPYTLHSIKIEGIDMEEYDRRVARIKKKLKRRLDEILDLRLEIEEFIDTIDDSLTRQMIMLRYINGLKWEEVAACMGNGYTADGLKKQNERFMKKL